MRAEPQSIRRGSRWMLEALRCFTLALAGSCSMFTASERPAPRSMLFIGNSLTDANGLHHLVQAMADGLGIELRVGLGGGSGSLSDHWHGSAPAEIDRGWDIVVLQQGPTSRAVDRVELRMIAARYAARIRAMGGEPAFYMVWPAAQNADDFPSVMRSYRLAAEDVNGYLYPVAEAWLEAWRRDLSMPLYGADNFHPSAYGTYVAALTIIAVTYRRSVVGMPYYFSLPGGETIWVNPADAVVLQASVDEAVRTHARWPR